MSKKEFTLSFAQPKPLIGNLRKSEKQSTSEPVDKFTETAIDIGLLDAPEGWYTARCLDAITIVIILVYHRQCFVPVKRKRSFKPVFFEEIFGSRGEIFGYHNLNVDIYYLANSAKCYVEIKYTGKATPPFESAPDNILEKLTPWLPRGVKTRRFPFFVEHYKERRHSSKIFGTELERVQIYNPTDNDSYNYIFTSCENDERHFKQFHTRFQSMTIWFFKKPIQIDVDDPNWLFIYVYEERNEEGMKGVYPVGFIAIYKYSTSPNRITARITQLFVMPPCQRMGIGTHLLTNAYKVIAGLHNGAEIVAPATNMPFSCLRDMVDCQLLMQIEQFDCNNIHKGFSDTMSKVANEEYKLNKRRVRRVYEILRMAYIKCNMDDRNYKLLCEEISKQLRIPFKRRTLMLKKRLEKYPHDEKCRESLQKSYEALEAKIVTYMTGLQTAATTLNKKLWKPSFE
ncbi:histone acetyltransferase type B catalytic subunit-like [Photinus pyralis]|uniref:histone acetyltransferase type B catalytic subunit-like n=1 Tax=Photinus pyralis TaxID=7054 RepID=UPI0012670E0F|nr:histone acetyltransferase type B catalytic subunit-like [Photinus pyralis]